MTTTTRPAHLHYRYAELAGQLLACLAILVGIGVCLLTSHYGDTTTLNEGYVLSTDTSLVQVGLEVRGTPGVFGHVDTPWGVLGYYSDAADAATSANLDGFTFCPADASDTDCGA